jgi:Na+-transporting NADH:ubiquinone oxidoreductase subunit F
LLRLKETAVVGSDPGRSVAARDHEGGAGTFKIDINGKVELTVDGVKPLLQTLADNNIFLPTACGGKAICGLCKVKVLEGGGPLVEAEEPLLTDEEREGNIRLSCQVAIKSDLKVEIPDELLGVQEYRGVCSEIEELTYDTRFFRLELKEPAVIDFVPGQYIQLLSPRYKESSEEVYRAYSIASDPVLKNIVELIIRRVPNGISTTYCFEHLKVGDTVRFNGPFGDFQLSETEAPMIFIAGASGMAPFVSILHHMRNINSKRKVIYFFGGNEVRDLFFLEQMRQFERELADFKFIPVAAKPAEGESWDGERGLVTEAVKRYFDSVTGYEGYLCGSPGMIGAAAKVLLELGMDEEKIYYDKFV